MAFLEHRWADSGQGNFLSLGGGRTTNWPKEWSCEKETGIQPHYYFLRKNLKFYNKKEEDHSNGTLQWHPLPQVLTANKQNTNHSLIHNKRSDINNVVTIFKFCLLSEWHCWQFTAISLLRWNTEAVLQLYQNCFFFFFLFKNIIKVKTFSVGFHYRYI